MPPAAFWANPRHTTSLARIERRLAGSEPVRGVIGFLSDRPGLGQSAAVALTARVLDTLAPGTVAVLDVDGRSQSQRRLLDAGPGGDLRALRSAATPGHPRRLVDQYLARTDPALLVPADRQRDQPLNRAELSDAAAALQRRFPTVLIDLPSSVEVELAQWLVASSARLVVSAVEPPAAIEPFLTPDRGRDGLTVLAPAGEQSVDADLAMPPIELAATGSVTLGDQRPEVRIAIGELALRLTG